MALTVEPGCYVRPAEGVPERFWNIGVRIEDDVVVTAAGCEILTRAAPKRIDEIEALMGDARGAPSKGGAKRSGASKAVK
jgi:Xaa-Pro aminopeptidase